jgi:DNA gyrase subunit A
MEVGIIRPVNLESEMKASYLDYAMSVIVQRALPTFGMAQACAAAHPVPMHNMNLRHNTPYARARVIVGEVLKEYHPHGETAVYDALVRMAQDFSLRYQLVDGQGNFGCSLAIPRSRARRTEKRF